MSYGKELILDLYGCDVSKFNRESIKDWLDGLCKLIGMDQEDLHFWDYSEVRQEHIPYDKPHLVGTSAIQFITTSDIVIHTVDMLGECYINLFSCKDYDSIRALDFTKDWFGSGKYEYKTIERGRLSKCNNILETNCFACVSHGKCSGGQVFCRQFKKEIKE